MVSVFDNVSSASLTISNSVPSGLLPCRRRRLGGMVGMVFPSMEYLSRLSIAWLAIVAMYCTFLHKLNEAGFVCTFLSRDLGYGTLPELADSISACHADAESAVFFGLPLPRSGLEISPPLFVRATELKTVCTLDNFT